MSDIIFSTHYFSTVKWAYYKLLQLIVFVLFYIKIQVLRRLMFFKYWPTLLCNDNVFYKEALITGFILHLKVLQMMKIKFSDMFSIEVPAILQVTEGSIVYCQLSAFM